MSASPQVAAPSRSPFKQFVVRFTAGDTIFNEGDVGATMYIVQSGSVRLFREVDGHRRVLAEMEKGDFFGEMSILEGLPRNMSAEAAETCDLIEIGSATFDKMIKGNIEIAVRLLRKLSIRLREAERRVEEFEAAGVRAAPTAQSSSPAAAQPTARIRNGARLESNEDGVTFALAGDETLIGRYDPVTELKPDVDLTEIDLKRTVSRRHARVVRAGDGYTVIEEVGALNGTFVEGVRLTTGEPHPLVPGDKLSLGMVNLVFRV